MKKDIVRILRENARLSEKEIAGRLDRQEKKIADAIKSLENDGSIYE
ncbi:MAG: winged helix-turn-helix domain-containing protein [Victivallales bacterium]